jgi:hypothetical protein
MSGPPKASFEVVEVLGLNGSQAGVEQLALGDNDDVEPRRNLVTTENLSNESFGPVSLDCSTQALRGRDAQAADGQTIRQEEQRRKTSTNAEPLLVDTLELSPPADALVRPEICHRGCGRLYSLLTVKRLRPFARRRFRTRRPFLVLIRTRNPCVRLRWRLFG